MGSTGDSWLGTAQREGVAPGPGRPPRSLSAGLVPYPPEPQPGLCPPRLKVPRPSPRPRTPVISRPLPGHLARWKLGSRHSEALTCPPLRDPAQCAAASAADAVQQRRDFPSAPSRDRALSCRKRLVGRTGRGSSPGALGHLPAAWHLGTAAAPRHRPAGPAPNPGRPGAAARGRGWGCRELAGRSRGRCLTGRPPGLLPSPRAQ